MPTRSTKNGQTGSPIIRDFRKRYDALERQRQALAARLRLLAKFRAKHPAYASAEALLTRSFRKASVAQRLAVLNAASWLIDVLESLPFVL